MAQCLAPGCSCGKMAKSHIIPQSFARLARKDGSKTLKISSDGANPSKQQNGLFAYDILCEYHEAALSPIDDRAFEILKKFKPNESIGHYKPYAGQSLTFPDIARFLYSIAWRASATNLSHLSHFSVGPYEKTLGRALFDSGKFPPAHLFSFALLDENLPPKGYYILPDRVRLFGMSFMTITIGGIRFALKLDKQLGHHLVGRDRKFYQQLVGTEETGVVLTNTLFVDSPDFMFFKDAVKAHRARSLPRSS